MASPEFDLVLQLISARPADYHQAPFERMRKDFQRMTSMVPAAADVELEEAGLAGVPALWVRPEGADLQRVVLYLHGGGYVVGSPRTHRELVAQLARAAGATAVAIDYRLAPENPFPAGLDDARAAYLALLDEGLQAGQIVVAGDSAGGGLAMGLLVPLRDEDVALPAGAVLMSPWTDLTLSGRSLDERSESDPMLSRAGLARMAAAYLAGQPADHPWASPVLASLTGVPPLLVQVGTREVLFDDSTRLVERARAAGVAAELEVYDEMIHFWQFFAAFLPEGEAAVRSIGEFVRGVVG